MDDLQNRIKKNLEKNIKNNEYDLFKQTLLAKINIIDKDDLDYINLNLVGLCDSRNASSVV